MIDQREVFSAQILKQLNSLTNQFKISENDLNTISLWVVGSFACANGQIGENFSRSTWALRDLINEFLGASTNEYALREIWQKIGLEIEQLLDIKALTEQWPIRHYLAIQRIYQILQESSFSNLASDFLFLFDILFYRYTNRDSRKNTRESIQAAVLADVLGCDSEIICDYFMSSGDLAIRQKMSHGTAVAYTSYLPEHELALRLRLALYGITIEKITRNDIATSKNGFFLVDHPSQNSTRDVNFRDRSPTGATTSFHELDMMFSGQQYIGTTLAIITGSDRTSSGDRQHLREHLARGKYLIAIIDMPTEGKRSAANAKTAWLIAHSTTPPEGILCIDTAKLARLISTGDSATAVEFAGYIVGLWRRTPATRDMIEQFLRTEAGLDFEGLFRHEFQSGYQNVQRLCKVVQMEDIRAQRYNLTAAAYLKAPASRSWLSSLDSTPVLELINETVQNGARIYVIGNNGEGKSLLLRDLVGHLGQSGIRTCGIAFGLADRFPLPKGNGNNESAPFVYLGARTSPTGIAIGGTEKTLSRLMRIVQTDQRRLEVFNSVTSHLGFGHRHYLIPSQGSDRIHFEKYSDVIELSDDARANFGLFPKMASSTYTLGVMRRDQRNSITPISELSSGEQQVITLAIKLVAEANPNTVILVDEPEISLHVNWQRALPSIFALITENLHCSIVIATHSPVIVASANKVDDYCFVAKRRRLLPIPLAQRASVETVLFEGFQSYTQNNRRVHERCATIVAAVMKIINQDDGKSRVVDIQPYLDELEIMKATIESAGLLQESMRDLRLLDSARAAIEELQSETSKVD